MARCRGRSAGRSFSSSKWTPSPGPADRNVFADQPRIELYDPDSGNGRWQSYFEATPLGLAAILREKSWKYRYAAETLGLPRYDLEQIRRADLTPVMASHEFFKDQPQPEQESF